MLLEQLAANSVDGGRRADTGPDAQELSDSLLAPCNRVNRRLTWRSAPQTNGQREGRLLDYGRHEQTAKFADGKGGPLSASRPAESRRAVHFLPRGQSRKSPIVLRSRSTPRPPAANVFPSGENARVLTPTVPATLSVRFSFPVCTS